MISLFAFVALLLFGLAWALGAFRWMDRNAFGNPQWSGLLLPSVKLLFGVTITLALIGLAGSS